MSKTFKFLITASVIVSSILFSSCGGGSSSDDEPLTGANTDVAPTTIDGLSLDYYDDGGYVFNFTRGTGDASTGTESGTAPSFIPPTGTRSFTNVTTNVTTTYDAPLAVQSISYQYSKTGTNSGLLILQGKGIIDADSTNPTFFVNSNGAEFWQITLNLNFGSADGLVSNLSADITQTNFFSDGRMTTTTRNSASDDQKISLKQQDGANFPVGYDSVNANLVVRTTSTEIYPLTLPSELSLDMTFDAPYSDTGARTYEINSVSSDNAPASGGDILDSGFAFLRSTEIRTNENTQQQITNTITIGTTPFTWERTGASNQAILTIGYTLTDDSGEITGNRTERYYFRFDAADRGRFIRVQPDTTPAVKGSFLFPFSEF